MDYRDDEWNVRPWLMALFLGFAALLYHFTIENISRTPEAVNDKWIALAAFVGVGSLGLAFTLERFRWIWSLIFALAVGAVMAGVVYWNAGSSRYGFDFAWPFWSGLLSVAIAGPLFQTYRDQGRWNFPYHSLHSHVWTDVVIFFAATMFTGISFALAHLLAGLFGLIGIDFLAELLRDEWFGWLLAGTAFGGALGLLRESDRLLATLQKLVLTILSLLAPVLAVGLVLFLLSLPFTGLAPLWEATRGTTPILLSCAIGAVILANTVIRYSSEEASQNKVMQVSAMALALTILPLSVIAAISIGLRLNQYGFSPDRIWGLVVVVIGLTYGLTYFVTVVWRRNGWADKIRPANTRLAMSMCVVAVLLALPILDFGSISTSDQMARLKDGRTTPEKFDYAALAYDFGPKGRVALEELKNSSNSLIASAAKRALDSQNRWSAMAEVKQETGQTKVKAKLKILPVTTKLPEKLIQFLAGGNACAGAYCTVYWAGGATSGILLRQECGHVRSKIEKELEGLGHQPNNDGQYCWPVAETLQETEGFWSTVYDNQSYNEAYQKRAIPLDKAAAAGELTIRPVKRKQLYIGDEALGAPFE